MAWWNKLFGCERSGRVDYYDEGLALLGEGKLHEALTSLQLALKEQPGDPVILQQIAIVYTRITDDRGGGEDLQARSQQGSSRIRCPLRPRVSAPTRWRS